MSNMGSSDEKDTDSVRGSKQKTGTCLLCLEWLTKKLKLVEDGATPPNWKYIGLVFLALFSSASTLTFLFPFLPEMMLTLGYSETDKGTYVGMVAASVFAGRIIGSVFWGWLADRHGRKLVLLITIALNGLFAGLFGFATNLVYAIIFRFLCGVANGTVGTGKTVLYDISDNTNQALSVSMLSISWGMGMIVGPTVGGFLASPAVKWPHVFSHDGLFGQFPYLLSSMFPFVSCFLIFIIIFFKFDETLVKSSKRNNQELTVSETGEHQNNTEGNGSHRPLLEPIKSQDSISQICQSSYSVNAESESAAVMALVLTQSDKSKLNPTVRAAVSVPDINNTAASLESSQVSHSISNIYSSHHHGKDTNVQIISEKSTKNGKSNFTTALPLNELKTEGGDMLYNDDNKPNQNMLNELENKAGSGIDALHEPNKNGDCGYQDQQNASEEADHSLIDTNEALKNGTCKIMKKVVIAKPEKDNEKICGCMESLCRVNCCRKTSLYKLLRLSDVWATVMLYTVFSMITISIEDIFPVFASTTESYGVSFSAMVSLVCCQCIPMVRLLKDNRVWLWICLLGVQVPFKIATNCCFAGTSLLINNAVTQELAGQANGLAMMATAMGRTIAPVLAGILFSWTVKNGQEIGPPFDTSFPFFLIGALFFVTIFECLHLNPKLDKQKNNRTSVSLIFTTNMYFACGVFHCLRCVP